MAVAGLEDGALGAGYYSLSNTCAVFCELEDYSLELFPKARAKFVIFNAGPFVRCDLAWSDHDPCHRDYNDQ